METLITNYNNTIHRGIKMTPNQAWNDILNKNLINANENKTNNSYNNEFKISRREKFNKGDTVVIENNFVNSQNTLIQE